MSLRGAVSIARRLQDPLAELVKIDPKSIGVGQYQHDLAEIKLSRSLDAVVEDCVNARRRRRQHRVGAAADPGLRASARGSPRTSWRTATPTARSAPARRCKEVPRLGPKAFEQCAGFLRIPGGDDPLDSSSVHPEAYPVVRRILDAHQRPTCKTLIGNGAVLRALKPAEFVDDTFGLPTVTDILERAGEARPRPAPGVQDGDLRRGRREDRRPASPAWCWRAWSPTSPRSARSSTSACTRTGWCTCRRCPATFVKDPREVVKPGDIVRVKVLDVDIPRKRISLTLRLDDEATTQRDGRPGSRSGGRPSDQAAGQGGGRDGNQAGARGAGRPGDRTGGKADPAGGGNRDRRGGKPGQRGGGQPRQDRGGSGGGGALAEALRKAGLDKGLN